MTSPSTMPGGCSSATSRPERSAHGESTAPCSVSTTGCVWPRASWCARMAGSSADQNGRIFVADEGGSVWTMDPARRRFATLPTPDDVVVGRAGDIFVNTLGDNAIHEFDAQGHQVSMMSGINQPQGIALDGADNLYYTETGNGQIGRVVRSFILDPPKVTGTRRGTFVICPTIHRAAGFSKSLKLLAPNAPAATLQLVQPGTDSSGKT